MFQMSVSNFHCPSSFCQTTAYLRAPSCGVAPLGVNVQVPISRAALRPSGLTSIAGHLTSPSCCIAWVQKPWISEVPLTIGAPAGSTWASSVYMVATAAASPLLNAAPHWSSSFWIAALLCAKAGAAQISTPATLKTLRKIRRGMQFLPILARDIPALSRNGQSRMSPALERRLGSDVDGPGHHRDAAPADPCLDDRAAALLGRGVEEARPPHLDALGDPHGER